MTTAWTRQHLANLPAVPPAPPLIGRSDLIEVLPGYDVWDMWPLAFADGRPARVDGGILWFALSAPRLPDPVARHGIARIRLLHQHGDHWRDAGNALPDGLSPGSREWSGSALFDPCSGKVTLFFTAAGRRGEPALTMEQRLFQIEGDLQCVGGLPSIAWTQSLRESVVSDDVQYRRADQAGGKPGEILAFRDPAYFLDPADGRSYLLFAASLKRAPINANGAIGIACATDDTLRTWRLLPPLLHAEGVNRELERPHIVVQNGLYYLFWSTQTHVFAPGMTGPVGLYGMVAPLISGPYEPLNGSGLVLANPPEEPLQAYSWWVMGDGLVTSFVDVWGLDGRTPPLPPHAARQHFGGVPAPFLRLRLQRDRALIEPAVVTA